MADAEYTRVTMELAGKLGKTIEHDLVQPAPPKKRARSAPKEGAKRRKKAGAPEERVPAAAPLAPGVAEMIATTTQLCAEMVADARRRRGDPPSTAETYVERALQLATSPDFRRMLAAAIAALARRVFDPTDDARLRAKALAGLMDETEKIEVRDVDRLRFLLTEVVATLFYGVHLHRQHMAEDHERMATPDVDAHHRRYYHPDRLRTLLKEVLEGHELALDAEEDAGQNKLCFGCSTRLRANSRSCLAFTDRDSGQRRVYHVCEHTSNLVEHMRDAFSVLHRVYDNVVAKHAKGITHKALLARSAAAVECLQIDFVKDLNAIFLELAPLFFERIEAPYVRGFMDAYFVIYDEGDARRNIDNLPCKGLPGAQA